MKRFWLINGTNFMRSGNGHTRFELTFVFTKYSPVTTMFITVVVLLVLREALVEPAEVTPLDDHIAASGDLVPAQFDDNIIEVVRDVLEVNPQLVRRDASSTAS